jgi:hypothetical protein
MLQHLTREGSIMKISELTIGSHYDSARFVDAFKSPKTSPREFGEAVCKFLAAASAGKLNVPYFGMQTGHDERLVTGGRMKEIVAAVAKLDDEDKTTCHVFWQDFWICAARSLPVSQFATLETALRPCVSGVVADVAQEIAWRASTLAELHPGKALRDEERMQKLAEDIVLSRADEKPSLHSVVAVLNALVPRFSQRLFDHLLNRLDDVHMDSTYDIYNVPTPRRGLFLYLVRNPVPAASLRRVINMQDDYLDIAACRNPAATFKLALMVYERYESGGGQHPRRSYVGAAPGMAAHMIATDDSEGIRGLARSLFSVADDLRQTVARTALRAILRSPAEDDHDAAGAITLFLGDEAGAQLVDTGVDRIAHGVINGWRFTTGKTWEALAGYPREVVRRKIVPGGRQWGEPYIFTPEEFARLESVIVPRLLKDRSKEVRRRAGRLQAFLEWQLAHPNLTERDYEYPAQWEDNDFINPPLDDASTKPFPYPDLRVTLD